jgi:NAD+ diphosphatase
MTQAEQPDVNEQPGVPPLARTTLDRAAQHRKDDAWLADAWARGLLLVVDIAGGGKALVHDLPDGGAELVLTDTGKAPEGERLFLGIDPDGTPLFTVDAELPSIEGARPATLRDVGHDLDARDAGVFSAAAALGNWHQGHRGRLVPGRSRGAADVAAYRSGHDRARARRRRRSGRRLPARQ